MNFRMRLVRIATLGGLVLAPSWTLAAPLQVLRNGGFEEDELTYRAEPASSCGGEQNDQWFNQQDRFPDVWVWPGQLVPGRGTTDTEWPRAEVTLDGAGARMGRVALRLQGKTVRIEQSLSWNSIGDLYADLSRYNDHTAEFAVQPGLFKDLVLDGWYKCQDVPTNASGIVSIRITGLVDTNLAVAKGSAEWTAFQVQIPATDLNQKVAKGNPGRDIVVGLAYTSPSGAGQVWFDDLSLTVAERTEPNLLPNPSFEQAAAGAAAPAPTGRGTEVSGAPSVPAGTPYPAEWSRPLKWLFVPQPTYYIGNSWQHFLTPGRGCPRLDGLVSHSGTKSLRFEMLPGDEYAVDGLMFMSSGNGIAWWGDSILGLADGRAQRLLDGRLGRDSAQFRAAQLRVDGVKTGSVRVIGENRQLALKDGRWTDNLGGEDLWGFFGDGWLGDGVTYYQPRDKPLDELFLSYTYDDSPRCLRVYEITPGR